MCCLWRALGTGLRMTFSWAPSGHISASGTGLWPGPGGLGEREQRAESEDLSQSLVSADPRDQNPHPHLKGNRFGVGGG